MPKKRGKNKDNARRSKKKISILNLEKVEYVDYKDVNLLRRFMSDRAKIRARRVTGNDAQQKREVAQAIKNALEMALLPYTNRVTQSRTGGGGRGRDRDREASEGPMPTPAAPPPSPAGPPPARGDEGTDAPEVDAPEVVEVETVEAGSSDA
jgi:small subunit ribosomal protein S18